MSRSVSPPGASAHCVRCVGWGGGELEVGMRVASYVVGAILALVAVLIGAYGVLGTLYGEVAIVGIGVLLLALPFAIAAWWAFSRSAPPRGWGILALVAFGAAVALWATAGKFADPV